MRCFFFLICMGFTPSKNGMYIDLVMANYALFFNTSFREFGNLKVDGETAAKKNMYIYIYIPCLKTPCDSVLTSISEISLKGIDIESCNHRFSRDWTDSTPNHLSAQKFCRSHRWCLYRTCDGGFLVPFVGSDGWSLGRSLGGKQSPCLCSSDSAGKGRGNVELKK